MWSTVLCGVRGWQQPGGLCSSSVRTTLTRHRLLLLSSCLCCQTGVVVAPAGSKLCGPVALCTPLQACLDNLVCCERGSMRCGNTCAPRGSSCVDGRVLAAGVATAAVASSSGVFASGQGCLDGRCGGAYNGYAIQCGAVVCGGGAVCQVGACEPRQAGGERQPALPCCWLTRVLPAVHVCCCARRRVCACPQAAASAAPLSVMWPGKFVLQAYAVTPRRPSVARPAAPKARSA